MTKQEILSNTHYGIKIYAYVLRCYYPEDGTVLSLNGRDCKPAKNPFNGNKVSLMVTVVNGCATHTDSNDPTFIGDVFDFAQLHFKLENDELLEAINSAMNLNLNRNSSYYPITTSTATSGSSSSQSQVQNSTIHAPQFSVFKAPISNVTPYKNITLTDAYNAIKGKSFEEITTTLRAQTVSKEAKAYKAKKFSYACFSGTFARRNDKSLLKHSGLLTIDFDHISNVTALKGLLLCDPYFETELLFTSPSGDGVKWVIPIDLKVDTHLNYFLGISNYIRETYKVEIDTTGKDISRACFLPHDPEVCINPKYLNDEQ